jgi:hypothetical protein
MQARVGTGAVLAASALVLLGPTVTALADPAPTHANGSNQQVAGLEKLESVVGKLVIDDAREDIQNLRRHLQQRRATEGEIGSIFAYMLEYQKQLNREAREDKRLRIGEVLNAVRARVVPICRGCSE